MKKTIILVFAMTLLGICFSAMAALPPPTQANSFTTNKNPTFNLLGSTVSNGVFNGTLQGDASGVSGLGSNNFSGKLNPNQIFPPLTNSGSGGGSGGSSIVDITDMAIDTTYTNSSTSNLLVIASVKWTTSGNNGANLQVDQLSDGTFETAHTVRMIAASGNEEFTLAGFVLPGGSYKITTLAGSVSVISTTCQRIYTSGGGGGGGGGSGVTNGQILTDAVLNGNTIIANATVTNLNAQFVSGGASLLTNANATTLFGPPSGNVTLGQTGTNIGGYIQLNTNLGGTFALNSGNLSSIVGTPSKLTLTAPNITGIGTFNGDGGGMTNVNASTLNADTALYRLSNTNCFFGWMGDSIVAGSTLSNSWALSDRAARLDFFKGRGITTNISVGGSGVTNALDRYYSIMGPLLRSAVAAGRDSYVFCNSMVNDIAGGYVNGTALSISNWYFQRFLIESNVVFDGGKMVEIGGLYYSNVPYSTVEIINALNKAMREQTNGYVYAYVPSRSVLPSPLDTNLFQGDFLHPTYKGQDVLAHLINSTMLEQGMHQYGEAYAMNINRMNTDDRNLAIGSGADAGTRFQLAASSDRTIDNLISFTFGTPANSKDVAYFGVVGSAGNSFLGSKANDMYASSIGGHDFVIATWTDIASFPTQRVRIDLSGLATFYGGATVAGGQFTGSGAGLTGISPSAISSNGTYFPNGTLAPNSGAGGSLAGPFLTEAGTNRAYSYNAQSFSNGVPLASLGPNSLLSSNNGAALIAALASGGSVPNGLVTNGGNASLSVLTNISMVIGGLGSGIPTNSGWELVLSNQDVATSGNPKNSPALTLQSHGFNTTASASTDTRWMIYDVPTSTAGTPTHTLTFGQSISNSAVTSGMTLRSDGFLTTLSGITSGGNINAGLSGDITAGLNNNLGWAGSSFMRGGTSGTIVFFNGSGTSFTKLQLWPDSTGPTLLVGGTAGNTNLSLNVPFIAPAIATLATNTLTFTTVSSLTNTLGRDAFAIFSAGTSVILQDTNGNNIATLGTVATLDLIVPMRVNMRASGTGMTAVIY